MSCVRTVTGGHAGRNRDRVVLNDLAVYRELNGRKRQLQILCAIERIVRFEDHLRCLIRRIAQFDEHIAEVLAFQSIRDQRL